MQPTSSPLSRDVSSSVASAEMSGIEKAIEGMSPAYSDEIAWVPLAENVPAGT